ncbi:MAG: ABC transporter ATP-binding protein [Actinomycetota bacterium]
MKPVGRATPETVQVPGMSPHAVSPRGLVRTVTRRRRRDLILGSVFVMLHQASEAVIPIMIGLAIDRAIVTGDEAAMARWVGLLVIVFVVLSCAGLVGYYSLERAQLWIAHDVRQGVVGRALDPRGGVGVRSGDVVSIASNDAEEVGAVSWAIGLGAGALPALVGGSVFLLAVSLPLGLVIMVGVPIVVVVVMALSRPLVGRSEQEQAAVATATGVATDLLRGLRVLTGLGVGAAASPRYRVASRSALAARLRSARFFAGYEGLTLGVSGALVVVVAWLGGRLALEGDITVGQLVAAVGLAQFLIGPLSLLIESGALVATVRAAAHRVVDLRSRPTAVDDDALDVPSPDPKAPAVHLEGVGDRHLTNVHLAVDSGAVVGIVAEPAEAAAIVELLGRRRDPDRGRLLLGGVDVRDWPLDRFRREVVVSAAHAELFDGALGEQIAVAAEPMSIDAAIEAAAVDEVLDAVPDGLGARIGEYGRRLSGGQRQRVVLARALATDAPVLVLHDPTTAVDASTEHLIAGRVARLRRGRGTTIFVTTTPALLSICDRVAVVRDGATAATGRHDELLHDPAYVEQVLR